MSLHWDSPESKIVLLIFKDFLNKSSKQISICPSRLFQKEIFNPLGALSFQEFPENFPVVSRSEMSPSSRAPLFYLGPSKELEKGSTLRHKTP